MKKIFKGVKTIDVSFNLSAPTGIAGDVTRPDVSNVEPGMLKLNGASVYPTAFGVPLAAVTGGFAAFTTSNVAADFQGILIREVPQQTSQANASADLAFGGAPNVFQPNGILVRGYCSVVCQYGTPARDGIVYIRIAATSGSRLLGGFEATSDAGNNVALSSTQAVWASDGMDANNNAEIRVAR